MTEEGKQETPVEEPAEAAPAAEAGSEAAPEETAPEEPKRRRRGRKADEERSMQAQLQAIERENTRHATEFAGLLGVEVSELHVCPVCEGVGFTPTAEEPPPPIEQAGGVMECPTCRGYGALEYPTRVEGQRLQVCVDCAGSGWKRIEASPSAAPAATPAVAGAAPSNGPQPPPGYILVPVDVNAGQPQTTGVSLPYVPDAQT